MELNIITNSFLISYLVNEYTPVFYKLLELSVNSVETMDLP